MVESTQIRLSAKQLLLSAPAILTELVVEVAPIASNSFGPKIRCRRAPSRAETAPLLIDIAPNFARLAGNMMLRPHEQIRSETCGIRGVCARSVLRSGRERWRTRSRFVGTQVLRDRPGLLRRRVSSRQACIFLLSRLPPLLPLVSASVSIFVVPSRSASPPPPPACLSFDIPFALFLGLPPLLFLLCFFLLFVRAACDGVAPFKRGACHARIGSGIRNPSGGALNTDPKSFIRGCSGPDSTLVQSPACRVAWVPSQVG